MIYWSYCRFSTSWSIHASAVSSGGVGDPSIRLLRWETLVALPNKWILSWSMMWMVRISVNLLRKVHALLGPFGSFWAWGSPNEPETIVWEVTVSPALGKIAWAYCKMQLGAADAAELPGFSWKWGTPKSSPNSLTKKTGIPSWSFNLEPQHFQSLSLSHRFRWFRKMYNHI